MYEGIDEVRRKEQESYERSSMGSTFYYLGVSPKWHEVIDDSLAKKLASIQKERRLTIHAIASEKTPEVDTFLANEKLTSIRYLPHIASEVSETQILPDRIMIKTFVEPYSVVEIINKKMAESYKKYFELLWASASQ